MSKKQLYLDLEDLKQSKSDGGNLKDKKESPTPFTKSLLGASVLPGAESDFWPTLPNREQSVFKTSDPGEDHY